MGNGVIYTIFHVLPNATRPPTLFLNSVRVYARVFPVKAVVELPKFFFEELKDGPIPTTLLSMNTSSPSFPPGLTNDALISVETPVIHWPRVATARDPMVSVRERITPPCNVYGEEDRLPSRRERRVKVRADLGAVYWRSYR